MIQLFLNLIQNAIQAMPKGGVLGLKSGKVKRKSKSWAFFEISDSGIGIKKSAVDKNF